LAAPSIARSRTRNISTPFSVEIPGRLDPGLTTTLILIGLSSPFAEACLSARQSSWDQKWDGLQPLTQLRGKEHVYGPIRRAVRKALDVRQCDMPVGTDHNRTCSCPNAPCRIFLWRQESPSAPRRFAFSAVLKYTLLDHPASTPGASHATRHLFSGVQRKRSTKC